MNPAQWNVAPLAPLSPLLLIVGAFTIWLWGRHTAGKPGKPVAVLSATLSAIAALAAFGWQQWVNESRLLAGPNWMIVPGQAPMSIDLSFHLDGLSLFWLALVTVLGALTIALEEGTVARGRLVWRLLALAAAQLILLADNLVVVLSFWELSRIAAWRMTARDRSGDGDEAAPVPLQSLAADLPLLLGVVVCWLNFGSFQLSLLTDPRTLLALGPNQQAAMVLLGYCALCAAYARCLQFPFRAPFPPLAPRGGDDPDTETASASGLVTIVVPTGLYLLFRFQPWLAAEPGARTLLTGAGGLSALLWGGMALTQPTLSRSVVSFAAGSAGLVFVGIGCGGASLLLAGSLIAGSWALLQLADSNRTIPLRAAVVIAVAMCSGVSGQETVLNSAWSALSQPQAPLLGNETAAGVVEPAGLEPDRAATGPVIPVVIMLAHLLLSVSLFRGLFRHRQSGPSARGGAVKPQNAGGEPISAQSPSTILVVLVGLGAAPLLSWRAFLNPDGWPVATPGVLALLMAVALLVAWVLYGRPSGWPARLENACGGLATLSRRSFYADEAIQLVWNMPWSLLAWLAGASDRTFLEGMSDRLRDMRAAARQSLSESAGEGQTGAYVITLILGAAVVIVLLSQG